MPPVSVLILSPDPAPSAGQLVRLLDEAREALAEHHRRGFLAAGATTAVVRHEPPDDTPFGARLRRLAGELVAEGRPAGLVVLGAASIPLATAADCRALVAAAARETPAALANQSYSADVVAIARADLVLPSIPADLDSDNALPRWLAEAAGIEVRDLRARRHLAMDVDSPLDLLLLESNHDLEMLRDGPYPWSVKQRVLSRVGHLSNEAAAGFLEDGYDGQAAYVILAHLSESNNLPELARVAAERALNLRANLLANHLLLAKQHEPLRSIDF